MMRQNNKVFKMLIGAVFVAVAILTFVPNHVLALEWATGGGAGGSMGNCVGDCSNSKGYYDCGDSHGIKPNLCPRWILVPRSVYEEIISDPGKRVVGGYTSFPSCKTDQYILIAGNRYSDGSLKIQNINQAYRPLPYKEQRKIAAVATSMNNVTNYIGSSGEYMVSNFFNMPNKDGAAVNNRVLTYGQIIDEVVRVSGVAEKDLAVVCPSMIVEDQDTFEGEAIVNSATTTGWQKEDKTVTSYIDCDPVEGCMANFQHNLRRTAGTKDLTYSIERTSNYSSVEGGVVVSNQTATFSGNNVALTVRNPESSTVKLYPGQVVCEKLTFKPTESSNNTTLTACASALGDAQPGGEDVDGDSTLLKLEVRNESVDKYNNYSKLVYAKPGDNVRYLATYNPILQYTYNLKPQRMQINGDSAKIYNNTNNDTLGKLFNDKRSENNLEKDWNNAFSISGSVSVLAKDYTYSSGNTGKREEDNNRYTIQSGDVGEELMEVAKINTNDNVKTTPSQVRFVKNNDANLGNVITTEKSSSAAVRVPYNFNLNTCIKDGQSGNCVEGGTYIGIQNAGQKTTVYYEVDVEKKANSETTDGSEAQAYATKVPTAMTKIVIYKGTADDGGTISGEPCSKYGLSNDGTNCWYSNENKREGDGALNGMGDKQGDNETLSIELEFPDGVAGTSYCMASAVYPASSVDVADYGSKGWNNKNGNEMWRISKSVCFTIGKRPTFQVWGGSFYGNGNVTTASTTKSSLAVGDSLANQSKLINGTLVFGSWVEQLVVANGKVTGLASGAATGTWSSTSENNLVGGGSYENPSDFCKYRVPLSIANYVNKNDYCRGSSSGSATGEASIAHARTSVRDLLTEEEIKNVRSEDIIIGAPVTISRNEIYIQYTLENVYIEDNIIYSAEQYEELTEIPKAIIAAKNIIISCNVNQIDAILIAENEIVSCKGYTGKDEMANQPERANQLVVNGLVSTGKLELGRTYGMARGIASRIPAEIVNYDTSVLLWIKGRNETGGYGYTYQHELSPRY